VEQLIVDILPQMPVVAVLGAFWWYYRKDLLAQIASLERRVDTLEKQLFEHKEECRPEVHKSIHY